MCKTSHLNYVIRVNIINDGTNEAMHHQIECNEKNKLISVILQIEELFQMETKEI